jgi:hypothetical protein
MENPHVFLKSADIILGILCVGFQTSYQRSKYGYHVGTAKVGMVLPGFFISKTHPHLSYYLGCF